MNKKISIRQQKILIKKKRFIINTIVCSAIIILLIGSLFFSNSLEQLLQLKPHLSFFDNTMQVHFVNVNEGDCTLIRFSNGKTMLVDSGDYTSKEKLVHYIDNIFFKSGEKIFDYVVLTHSDIDHSGNMNYILNNYKVGVFYRPNIFLENEESDYGLITTNSVYCEIIDTLKEKNIETIFHNVGLKIQDNSRTIVEWLTPNVKTYFNNEENNSNAVNDYSPIILFNDGFKMILGGDASSYVEREAVNNNERVDIDVIKLGHHGSNTSTCLLYLNYYTPEYGVITNSVTSINYPAESVAENIITYDNANNKTLLDNLYKNSTYGNIIIQNSTNINFQFVKNTYNYLFIDWIYVVIIFIGIVLIYYIIKTLLFFNILRLM